MSEPVLQHTHLLSPFPTVTTTTTDNENLRPITSPGSRTSIETWIQTTQAAQIPTSLSSTGNPLKRKRTSHSTASQQSDSSPTVQTSNKEPACQPGSPIESSMASMPNDALALQVSPGRFCKAVAYRFTASSHALKHRHRKQSSLYAENR